MKDNHFHGCSQPIDNSDLDACEPASKVEVITDDDDDDLSSLCVWLDKGAISRWQGKWMGAILSANFWIK
ncbi:hypothetical protein [Duganella sp. Root1480D1]|uniref:hypothetical protein n=1 Tax=Duganella sp. Root1480D1 TaxID=1736471 RepID=UPI0012E34F9A|nr:hypothetical protein [Duganella sp. Root1480D1]